MKAITIIIIICLVIACKSQGQTIAAFKKMTIEQKAKLVTDSLRKILVLSDLQYPRAYTTVLETIKKAMPIVQSNDSRFSKRKQLQQIMAVQEVQAGKIFTPGQFALYKTRKQQIIAYYKSHWSCEKIMFTVPVD